MSKIVVIGLDGATWDLMMPLAAEGFLPNLHQLVQEGAWGELESTLPPITAPAWASFATGKNPGKTGIFDFMVPRDSLANLGSVTTKDISGRTFYELLDECGLSTVMINLPLSYPPRVQQPTVTCILTQGSQFVFPASLAQTIPEFADYRLSPDFTPRAQGRLDEYAEDIRRLERVRFTCAQKLFQREWDFFFLLFSGTDWIQHDLYSNMLSNSIPREHAAFQLLRDIDQYLLWFVEHLPEQTHFFLMSDHGFRSYQGTFLLNQWLKEQHLLHSHFARERVRADANVIDKSLANAAANKRAGVKRIPAVATTCRRFLGEQWPRVRSGNLRPIVQELNPARFGKKIAVDYSRTLAACTSPAISGIYLNSATRFRDGIVPDRDLKAIKEQVISGLHGLRDPLTGGGAFARVLENSEAYTGDRAYLGPDVLISPDKWVVMSSVTPVSRANWFVDRPVNSHATEGMLLAYGPGVKRGYRLQRATIMDMAPTILHLLGVPAPNDLDGRILAEVFEGEMAPASGQQGPLREKRRIARIADRLRKPHTT